MLYEHLKQDVRTCFKKKKAGVLSTEGLRISAKMPQSQLTSCEMRSVWLDWGQPLKSTRSPQNPFINSEFLTFKSKKLTCKHTEKMFFFSTFSTVIPFSCFLLGLMVCGTTGRPYSKIKVKPGQIERSEVCTVAAARRLCGLPVHGPLHGFLPPGEAELALWQDNITDQAWRDLPASETGLVCEFLTVQVDLRLVRLTCDLGQVTGAQVPHVHPLGCPRCHGRTQSRGLGHGGTHWTDAGHVQSV